MFFLMGAVGVAGWIITFVERFFLGLEYYERYGKQVLLVCSFGVAVVTTVAGVFLLLRRGKRGWAFSLGSMMVFLVGALALLPWNTIYGRTWFEANRGEFTALADSARQRKLNTNPSGYLRDRRGGQDVPIEVAPGRVLMLTTSLEEMSENMYLYIYDRSDAVWVDPCALKETTFDDYYRCTRLGDGWWWLDRKRYR